jgi:hypothetical protein
MPHVHASTLDGVVTLAYVFIGFALLRTIATRNSEKPWAQAIAYCVGPD